MMRHVTLLICAFVLAACTSYQSRGFTGGFSETQLSPTMYQVRFVGNTYTSEERATQFFLRRCAELALENGYRYFRITDEQGSKPGFWDSSRVKAGHLHLLEESTADAADAVIVVEETNSAAGGKLSERASAQLRQFSK